MIAHTPLLSEITLNENKDVLSNAFLTRTENSIEASLPIVTIKVGGKQCVALLDPAADTVIISKEFLSQVKHTISTNHAMITINTTNGSLKNTGLVASINVSSLDNSFSMEVKALTSPTAIIRLNTKTITARLLKSSWPKISQQATKEITNLHNGETHQVEILLSA